MEPEAELGFALEVLELEEELVLEGALLVEEDELVEASVAVPC